MYELKNKNDILIFNQTELAKKVGIDKGTLCRVFNKKQRCSKIMAYAIVKSINENAEIEDYFIRVK